MTNTNNEKGAVIEQRIYGKDNGTNRLFLYIWERVANSGMYLVWAKDELEAKEFVGYSPDVCFITIVKISKDSLPVQFGRRN